MSLQQVLSKKLTEDGAVSANPGKMWTFCLLSDGTNAGSVIFKDGGASGTEIWRAQVTATAGDMAVVTFPDGLSYNTSLYADVTNIGSLYVAYT